MANDRRQRRNLDVKKDPLDLRDVRYEPSLGELPFRVDNSAKSRRILDQGTEGACTGFGLAAVANYLQDNRSDKREEPPPVSPRMLYEMAKRYDDMGGRALRGLKHQRRHEGMAQARRLPGERLAIRPSRSGATDT